MIDYFLYINVKILSFLVCLMPIEFSLFIARVWGSILYYLLPKRARICYFNLKLAFGAKLSSCQRKKITRGVFRNLSMNFTELLYFPRIDLDYIRKHVRIFGRENVDAVLERKKGLVFLTAHFGNWELSSLVGEFMGCSMVVLAREQKFQKLNDLLNTYRQRLGSKVVSRGRMMRDLLTSLRGNASVGILGDQKAGTTGSLIEFFGRLSWTPTGAITLARHTGAGVLPVFMIREKGSYHRLEIRDELSIDTDDKRPLEKFNRILEEYIYNFPDQWLWFHRRWKASPNKNILILSDGRAGHLNQEKALVKIIEKVAEEKLAVVNRQPVSGKIIETKIVEVTFRNNFTKGLAKLSGLCAGVCCNGCLRCLRACLDDRNFRELSSFYADIVISCGSSLASLNLMLARANQAKSVVVMKPGLIPSAKFDMAIIPAHDRPRPGKNIVITQTALNLIDDESMREGTDILQSRFGNLDLGGVKKIGVLIGGDSKNYTLDKETSRVIANQLIKAAEESSARLLITTSRRTSPEVDSMIKEKFSGNSLCPLLIIANEKNIDGAVAGILGLSDIVVVTEESISMISEALSSHKPVIVLKIEDKKSKNTKHMRFLNNLAEKKYINIAAPEDLSEEIRRVNFISRPPDSIGDTSIVSEALSRLIV